MRRLPLSIEISTHGIPWRPEHGIVGASLARLDGRPCGIWLRIGSRGLLAARLRRH
jgi:hypothetical protein